MPPTPQRDKAKAGAGPSDAALVVAARAGERWAQEALFRRHSRMVNGLAYRLLGRDEEIDDLVQTSFLAAFHSLSRLGEPQAFASWLASIVTRTAHKLLRRRRLLTRLGLRDPLQIDAEVVVSKTAPPSVGVELRELYSVLESLDAQARIALVLQRVEGMSVPEVAAQMGVSESTVKRRLRVAEARLALAKAAHTPMREDDAP